MFKDKKLNNDKNGVWTLSWMYMYWKCLITTNYDYNQSNNTDATACLTSPAECAGSVAELSAKTQHLGSVQPTWHQVWEDKLCDLWPQLLLGLLRAIRVVESQQVSAQVTTTLIPAHPQSLGLVPTVSCQRRHSCRDWRWDTGSSEIHNKLIQPASPHCGNTAHTVNFWQWCFQNKLCF